jgi:NAD(P)-dependent dehydrogenase (short-subunit alcohol dehydrogenase family)
MKTSIRTHEGRVALVTGTGQGIGQAIALALAERGAQVIATDLALPAETVSKIGPAACAFPLDVTLEGDWRSVAAKSRDVGEVDIVVNNAGYFPNRSIDELDLPTWRKTMATNLDSHFLSVKYFLPMMRKKKWGRFVGISSNMVGLAIPGMSHYIATKMGIIGFMRGLANDVANDGITAKAVLPGLTNTQAIAPQSEEHDGAGDKYFNLAASQSFRCLRGRRITHRGGAASRTLPRACRAVVGCEGRLDTSARICSAGRGQRWCVGARLSTF